MTALPFRLTLSTTLALGLLALPAAAAELRVGLITPPSHQWTQTAQDIAADLAERSAGEITLVVLPSGQLGSEAQMLQQLQSGSLDFGMFTLGEFANRNADYGVFLAPFIATDAAAARALLRGDVAQELLGGFRQFGLHGLAFGMAGLREIVTATPTETAADLKGQKIRTVPLAPELDFWTLLGATPTPMPLPELYNAFANGQVDGMQIDYEGTWNAGYWEHAGEVIASDHMMFPMAAVASARGWAQLEPEAQALVAEVFATRIDAMVEGYGEIDSRYRAEIEAAGVPVREVGRDWFEPAVSAWYDTWRAKTPLLARLEAEAATIDGTETGTEQGTDTGTDTGADTGAKQ